MADSKEIALLKETFKSADKTGSGRFARADVAKVFMELDTWTEDEIIMMFDAFDTRKDGTINYDELVEWIMNDLDESGKDREGVEDSDDDDGEGAELEVVAEAMGIDLEERITEPQWAKIMRLMDVDEDDAEEIFERVQADMKKARKSVDSGIPIGEFLDDLQIEPEDHDAINFLKKALDKMKSGGADALGEAHHGVDIGVDKIVRELDATGRNAQDAWAVAMLEGTLSKKGQVLFKERFEKNQAALVTLVTEASVSPPAIPASAGQGQNRAACNRRVDKIIEECKRAGTKFTDPEWDLTSKSAEILYVDRTKPGWDCTVAKPSAYKRLTEISAKPTLFKGGVQAGDIKQGQIGTCFLLGAMGAIAANNGSAIEKLFIDYDIEVGVYSVRFCVHGEWTHVIVDDIMPVSASGQLLYARGGDPDEVWAPILEKAFCKLYTCYEMCDGGRSTEAIYSMFGGVSGKFLIKDNHKANPATYFKVLQNARAKGWLLTTTFVISKGAKTGGGKCGEAVLPTGLVGGHVYSVLKLVDIGSVKLICLRNPWGTGEWMGKYSDKNALGEWTEELKKLTGFTGKNDGKFWMSMEDFVANSGGVSYARTFGPEWKKLTQYKRFAASAIQATANWAYQSRSKGELTVAAGDKIEVGTIQAGWWKGNVLGKPETVGFFPANYVSLVHRPVARFDLQVTPTDAGVPVTAVVSLMQPNQKMARVFKQRPDGLNYKDTAYPGLMLIIKGEDGTLKLKRLGKKRCVSGELTLPGGGLWKVYCLSTDGNGAQFSTRVFLKGGQATLKEVPGATTAEIAKDIAG